MHQLGRAVVLLLLLLWTVLSLLREMKEENLNLCLSRFVEEVCNRNGQRYPLKRYLRDINGLEPLARGDSRFVNIAAYIFGCFECFSRAGVLLL